MPQLSALDANFLYVERPGLPQHIGGVSIYSPGELPAGEARFAALRELVAARLHYSPVFTRKLAPVALGLGQPWWTRDEDFDLDQHLRHMALPRPGNWDQLRRLAAHIHEQPLPRDRPLWELTLIDGVDAVDGVPAGSFAVLIKVHHATMDGRSGPAFMGSLHDLSPSAVSAAADTDAAPVPEAPSMPYRLRSAYRDSLRTPQRAAGLLRDALQARQRLRAGRRDGAFAERPAVPHTRFHGRIDGERIADACVFDFGMVRAIKQSQPGTTINDVMLAVVAGGLRRYLEQCGELPEQSLVAACPMDVHDATGGGDRTNILSILAISLCTDRVDPLERLSAIADASRREKAHAAALGPGLNEAVMNLLAAPVQSLLMQGADATGLTERTAVCNTVVSNVPGGPHQLYLCGSPMVAGFSLGPLMPNVGLFHTVYSAVQDKRGTLTLSITACRRMLPDSTPYIACLEASFAELAAACGVPVTVQDVPRLRAQAAPTQRRAGSARRNAVATKATKATKAGSVTKGHGASTADKGADA